MRAETVRQLYRRGCGMNGYLWGTPPVFKPHPNFEPQLRTLTEVFQELP
jgi:hypothetical protein